MMTLPCCRFRKNRVVLSFFSVFFLCNLWSVYPDWVLINTSRGILYYTLIPLGLDGRSPLGEDAERAKVFLKQNVGVLDRIPPESFLKIQADPTPYLLLGFFVSPERPAFPLVRARIPSIPGDAAFSMGDADMWRRPGGETHIIYPWEIELPRSTIQLDNRYLDWRNVRDLKQFPPAYKPEKVIRYRGGIPHSILFEQAITWPSRGTAIQSLKALSVDTVTYFMISSYSPMATGISYWFYLVPQVLSAEKEVYEQSLAIEIPIVGRGGPIFLWLSPTTTPIQIGSYVTDLSLLEGELDGKYFPEEIRSLLRAASRILFSVSVPAVEGREEYFITEFSVSEIPVEPHPLP